VFLYESSGAERHMYLNETSAAGEASCIGKSAMKQENSHVSLWKSGARDPRVSLQQQWDGGPCVSTICTSTRARSWKGPCLSMRAVELEKPSVPLCKQKSWRSHVYLCVSSGVGKAMCITNKALELEERRVSLGER
jgi:hypothetical protein